MDGGGRHEDPTRLLWHITAAGLIVLALLALIFLDLQVVRAASLIAVFLNSEPS